MAKRNNKSTVDRSTLKRRMVDVRKTILNRLKVLGHSRMWLAEQIGVRSATVYDFLSGDSAAKVETLEKILTVLGLEIRAKD